MFFFIYLMRPDSLARKEFVPRILILQTLPVFGKAEHDTTEIKICIICLL